MPDHADKDIREASLEYHRRAPPGKIAIQATKQLTNQRDLALAYSPGVAAACDEIVRDPQEAFNLTARGNLVGVVTNGTAVLGLGNIGPLAGKPVMEGKAVLFKKFAGLDCFDIELNEHDPDKLVDIIVALEPTFGGINLEDIKAPECFYIERKCRERMKIPVFHDDQHGTAIIVGAAVRNGLRVVEKDLAKVKLVCVGRRRCRARVPRSARLARHQAREHLGVRHRGRRLHRTHRGDGRQQGALHAGDEGAHAGRNSPRRGHLPRAVRRARAEARVAGHDGEGPADPGARQSRAGDHARRREGRAPRRDHRDRPLGFSEPGEQRPLLPVHLPRRARRRRNDDQRGDEARVRARDRRSRARRAVGHRRHGVRHREPVVRARIPDSEAVRSAPHRQHRARGGARGDGLRRRVAADRRFRRVQGRAYAVSSITPAC